MSSSGRRVAQRRDVVHRMDERDDFERRARRLGAREHLEFFRLERAFDRAQPIRTLGMAERRQMFEAGGMAEQQSRHL